MIKCPRHPAQTLIFPCTVCNMNALGGTGGGDSICGLEGGPGVSYTGAGTEGGGEDMP